MKMQSLEEAILRIADTVEDAAYVLETVKVVDVTVAASCSDDFDTGTVRDIAADSRNR